MENDRYTFRALTDSELTETYRQQMKRDFPPNELKPLRMIRDAVKRGIYACTGMFAGDEMAGYAFLLRSGSVLLLDYFAVGAARRGQGIGSRFLRQLRDNLQQDERILIESENPDFAQDDAERAVRTRRLHFYERNGCTDTGRTALVFGAEYRLLLLSSEPVPDAAALKQDYLALYRSMLPEFVMQRNIRLHW